ncbi:MAG: hypothetical protein AAGG00_03515 [Cyanobacteria bacterium P01_H01_bin.150]
MTAFNHSQEENIQQSEATNQLQQQSKDMRQQKKSIFGSKTFWGVVFTSTAAIAPIVGNNVDKIVQDNGTVDYGKDAAQIVVIVCGAAASIMGRVEAKSAVYTPKWMPGPNIKDFDSE